MKVEIQHNKHKIHHNLDSHKLQMLAFNGLMDQRFSFQWLKIIRNQEHLCYDQNYSGLWHRPVDRVDSVEFF